MDDQESSRGGVIEFLQFIMEFPPITHLVIHLCNQGILSCLEHWLSLIHFMYYNQKQAQSIAYIPIQTSFHTS